MGSMISTESDDVEPGGLAIANIRQYCLELCHTYVGGSWCLAKSPLDITINRVKGGHLNRLYHIRLNSNVPRRHNSVYPDEPTEVFIKLYNPKIVKNFNDGDPERFNDHIVETRMSQLGIVPKVYGIFDGGVIQAYVKSDHLSPMYLHDNQVIVNLGSTLARIHHTAVPISKDENLFLFDIRRMLNYAYDNCRIHEIAQHAGLKTLMSVDLRSEFRELVNTLKTVDSPIVFAHNDYRNSNLLVSPQSGHPILICDFEYSGYGYRGYDFAIFFDFMAATGKIDLPEVAEHFLLAYIDASEQLKPGFKQGPKNTLEHLILEARVFDMMYRMFKMGFKCSERCRLTSSENVDTVQNLRLVDYSLSLYLKMKEHLIQERLI